MKSKYTEKKRCNRMGSAILCTVMATTSIFSVPAYATDSDVGDVSSVAIDKEDYQRPTVLEVGGEPFWYNAIQIRIDKLRDDPSYACEDEQLQNLFQQVADDGFTVANSQIRWTDIQPNHTAKAIDTAYVSGGEHADDRFDDGIRVGYNNNESEQSLGYMKFKIDDMTQEEIDGAKIRLYCKSKLSEERKIKVYGISDDEWTMQDITWDTAPAHSGYEITGEGTELVSESPDNDWIKAGTTHYYDFDVSEYLKTSKNASDGTVSFVLQDGDGTDETNVSGEPIIFGDTDDTAGTGDSLRDVSPKLIYANSDEFNFEYLDRAIDFAKNAGLKFELLWFGTDTCSISSDSRVPIWALNNYQKTIGTDGKPLYKKFDETAVSGIYAYIMCKNDEALRAKEAKAVRKVFDHIAERGDDTVIGCQLSNEPGVGRIHGGKRTERCMCDICTAKADKLGVSDEEFREITMWEYNNNLAKAVKGSNYPVWTRVNLDENADVEGVSYNEKMRASDQGTCIDFIGIDHYRKTPSQLSMEGAEDQQFAQGKNLTMMMELGQKDDRSGGLYLEEDVLASLSGGAYTTIYDASSSDGCEIYTYDRGTKTFSPIDKVIPNLFKTNHMLKKIGYDLATIMPGFRGNNQLMFFNGTSSASDDTYSQNEVVGEQENKDLTFNTSKNGVGIAVSKDKNELSLLTNREDSSFTINNLSSVEDIKSAEVGYYDEKNKWVKQEDFEGLQNSDGKVSVLVPAYQCVRLVMKDGALSPIEGKVEKTIEAESNYKLKDGLKASIYDDGASAGGWLKVHAGKEGDYATITAIVPKGGVYKVETQYLAANNRSIVQIDADGTKLNKPVDMYNAKKQLLIEDSGEIPLTKGTHRFTYTVTGKNEASTDWVIPLDFLKLTRVGNNTAALKELYDQYKGVQQNDYTDQTWNKFQDELNNAQKVLMNEDALQRDIDTQEELLRAAIENLQVKTDKSKEELYQELETLIAEAEQEKEKTDIYSQEEIQKLEISIADAKTALVDKGDPAISPEYVATAVKKMREALEAFKETADHTNEVDKSALEALITSIESLDQKEYKQKSWNHLTEVLTLAKNVADNENAAQEAVDTAFLQLAGAFNKLERVLNTSAAEAMIQEAEAVLAEEDKYRPSDLENIEDALESLQNTIKAEETTQSQLDKQVLNLQSALMNVKEQVDPARLQKVVELAQEFLEDRDKYTTDTISNLEAAVEEAQTVLDDENRTQEQVGNAYTAVTDAIAKLQPAGDREVLASLIKRAELILSEPEKYTDQSIDGLAEALEEAQAVYENENALQKDVDEAAHTLATELSEVRILGDVNHDGQVDTLDAADLLKVSAEIEEVDESSSNAGDVNKDGVTDTGDAVKILKYASEIIETF